MLPFFISALQSLVKCSYNNEVHRALALFITYAFHSQASSISRTPKSASGLRSAGRQSTASRRPFVEMGGVQKPSQTFTRKQVGVKILEMYSDILCEKGNLAIVRKFARTVTNKVLDMRPPAYGSTLTMAQWLLYLLTEDDPEVVIHGCKIMARLLVAHGPSYATKFAGKSGGFYIMAHRLKRWWDIPTIWPICFSIFFGYDVAEIDFERPFDFFSLLATFENCNVVFPEALPIITAMLQIGLKDVLRNQEDPSSPSGDRDLIRPFDDPVPQALPSVGRPRARSMELTKELETRRG